MKGISCPSLYAFSRSEGYTEWLDWRGVVEVSGANGSELLGDLARGLDALPLARKAQMHGER